MTTFDQIATLVDAHYRNDGERFRRTVLQIAARLKTEDQKRRLLRATEQAQVMQLLPEKARGLAFQPTPCVMSDLTLAPTIAHAIERVALGFEHRLELLARGYPPEQRLLFVGEPGNGKTSAASALGARLGLQTFAAELSSLITSYMGATGANLGKLFEAMRAPIVLVLNELDCLGSHRDGSAGNGNKEYGSVTNTLLTLLDRPLEGILIATTNRPDMLDPALLRRFDRTIEFSSPSSEDIERHVRKLSARLGLEPIAIPEGHRVSFDSVTKFVMEIGRDRTLTLIQNAKVSA